MIYLKDIIKNSPEFFPHEALNYKNDTPFEDIRFLEKNQENFKSNILYIGYASTFNKAAAVKLPVTFLIIKDTDIMSSILENRYLTICEYPNTSDMLSIFNSIKKLFNHEVQFNNDIQPLMDSLIKSNDLDAVADKAALLVKNPIIITDSGYNIISYSKSVHTDDKIWQSGQIRGNLTYEFIAEIKKWDNNEAEDNLEYKSIIIKGISENRRRISKLFMNNMFLGYYIVLESNCLFEEIPDYYYKLVCDVISKEVSVEEINITRANNKSYELLIADILNSNFIDRSVFMERIKNTAFEVNTVFQLAAIDMKNFAFNDNMVQGALKKAIKEVLPYSWSLFYENYIIVLIDVNNKFYHNDNSYKNFTSLLEKHHLCAGLSDHFSDLYILNLYYNQAVKTLNFAAIFNKKDTLIYYKDYKFYHLISLNSDKEKLIQFCNENVLRIKKYDNKFNTEFLKTLFYYINSDKSISKTAEKLFVHRNTITYRIKRIKELFDIDLTNQYNVFQIYYSCLILMYMKSLNIEYPL